MIQVSRRPEDRTASATLLSSGDGLIEAYAPALPTAAMRLPSRPYQTGCTSAAGLFAR